MQHLRCILFDLDGTLVDTEPSLRAALEMLATELDLPAPAISRVREHISLGTEALLRLILPINPETPIPSAPKSRFLHLYQEQINTGSHLFPGIEEVLKHIEHTHRPWGVVTDKADRLAAAVLQATGLSQRSACLVGGDTLAQRKPDPAPLLHACRQLHVDPADSLYVGDAEQDMQAGRRAGMRILTAGYGYLPTHAQAEHWGGETVLSSPLELLDWLQQHG